MTRPAIFDQGIPPLSGLLALCAAGESASAMAPLVRYREAHAADPLADLLLRFIEAAVAEAPAALQIMERELGDETLDAAYFARLGASLGAAPSLRAAGRIAQDIAANLGKSVPMSAGPQSRAERDPVERDLAEKEAEIRRLRDELSELAAKREEQAALLDKLAYINEELEAEMRELLASRWRRLGRRLRLAKPASFER